VLAEYPHRPPREGGAAAPRPAIPVFDTRSSSPPMVSHRQARGIRRRFRATAFANAFAVILSRTGRLPSDRRAHQLVSDKSRAHFAREAAVGLGKNLPNEPIGPSPARSSARSTRPTKTIGRSFLEALRDGIGAQDRLSTRSAEASTSQTLRAREVPDEAEIFEMDEGARRPA
jgi:hypothetical protein